MATVTQNEVACLVHSWLIQQGFTKTASVFVVEAKQELRAISVSGSIRNLSEILSDYAKLKHSETERNKAQQAFFHDADNQAYFANIWSEFHSLLSDYQYYRQHCSMNGNRYRSNSNSTRHMHKKRKFNEMEHGLDDLDNLYELNANRFHELLQNSTLHEKMALLIQSKCDGNIDANKLNDDEVVDEIMNQCPFDELFVPLPIEEYDEQSKDSKHTVSETANTQSIDANKDKTANNLSCKHNTGDESPKSGL